MTLWMNQAVAVFPSHFWEIPVDNGAFHFFYRLLLLLPGRTNQ